MAYRNYSVDVSHIVNASGQGDFTTIQSAINASSAGATIFISPGIYTENISLIPGIELVGFSDSVSTIVGKVSYSGTGLTSMTNLNFTTNGDYLIEVTGSNNSQFNLDNCTFNITNHDGIHFTSSNPSSQISFFSCNGGPTSNFACFVSTAAGFLSFFECFMGQQTTSPSTISAGALSLFNCTFGFPVVSSGTSEIVSSRSAFAVSDPSTSLTIGGSGGLNASYSQFSASTQPGLIINSLAVMAICTVSSQNVNAISGTGTVDLGIITFIGNSGIAGTLTVNKLTTYGGTII